MGFAAQGCPQIQPAAGPRPWEARGAPSEGSSHGAPLGGREKAGDNLMRGSLMGCRQRAGTREAGRGRGMGRADEAESEEKGPAGGWSVEGGPEEGGREGAEHGRVAGLEGQVSSPLSWLAPDSERELLSECRTTSSIGEKGAIPANQCQT